MSWLESVMVLAWRRRLATDGETEDLQRGLPRAEKFSEELVAEAEEGDE